MVVAIEMASVSERLRISFENKETLWLSHLERNWNTVYKEQVDGHDWFFDGSYLYRFNDTIPASVEAGNNLSGDGSFRIVPCQAIHLGSLAYMAAFNEERCCLAFVAKNEEFSLSPPIWKSLGGIGNKNMEEEDGENVGLDQFDKIDAAMAVNINFTLSAAKHISAEFGYDSVEPLELPRLMIEMKTVNLPKLSKEVKATFDTGLVFSQVAAWLLGMQKRAVTFEQFMAVRRILKYLTTKGIFRKDTFNKNRVFVEPNEEMKQVPLLDVEEMMRGNDHMLLAA
jgi:hypothetical protein